MITNTAFPSSILFIVVTRIGDTLCATPMICAATAWPKAWISVPRYPKMAKITVDQVMRQVELALEANQQ